MNVVEVPKVLMLDAPWLDVAARWCLLTVFQDASDNSKALMTERSCKPSCKVKGDVLVTLSQANIRI